MKKKILYLNLILLVLIIINFIVLRLYVKEEKKSLNTIENNVNYQILEKNELKEYTSFLYRNEDGDLKSKIYDQNNKEIEISSLIKEDKIMEYNLKVEELLYLKYPKFITEELLKENVERTYLIRNNELVIYFSNYELNLENIEDLYLTINYNEIKDYLNYTVILDKEYQNEDGYNYLNTKKSVAITFDDSPNKNKTTNLLHILSDNKAHATFFVVGNKINSNKDILLSIKSFGNEIGSHTYSHKSMKKMTDEEIVNDFNTMIDLYYNLFQEDLKLIRPPYGSYKNSSLNLIPASFILWSLDTNDWRHHNSDYLVNYVLDNIKDGDIILFHDSYNSTINAVDKLLPLLYSKGYQVMSVSELFQIKNKELELNEDYRKVS